MPIVPTYPGVYIEEIPSGVRSIAGVATSICAFVGAASRGPVNDPVTVFNYGEFTRRFGGLSLSSPLSYAVRDFFQNGGGQAIIVRVVNDGSATSPPSGAATEAVFTLSDTTSPPSSPPSSPLTLTAANPGAWANDLRVELYIPGAATSPPAIGDDPNDQQAAQDVADGQGVNVADVMHLTVKDKDGNILENFKNVTVVDGPRRLDKVLVNSSRLLRLDDLGDNSTLVTLSKNLYTSSPTTDGADGAPPDSSHLHSNVTDKEGIHALEKADLFNLLVIPPTRLGGSGDIPRDVWAIAASYCLQKRAVLLVDPPSTDNFNLDAAKKPTSGESPVSTIGSDAARNAAFYYPRVMQNNPLQDGQLEEFAPCGGVAGIIARTDGARGIWKAPAGIDAGFSGVPKLAVRLTDDENGQLNQLGVNCLRTFSTAGRVVWGARTRKGADALASEWKYLPVRRTALYIEESLFRGLQWVVFEPNDEPLWAQIRLNVGSFMKRLFKQGAFQGSKPSDAFLVKCDSETTTQDDIDRGIVNIVVGFAPLKPAEFVIIKLQQLAGQSAA